MNESARAHDLVDALWRYLHRLDVLNSAFVSTHGAEVDRPVVGEVEQGVGDGQAPDLSAAFPVRHDLGAARVDVDDHNVIGSEQGPAASFCSGEAVVCFTLAHKASVIRRSEMHSARVGEGPRRLRTVSGSMFSDRVGGSGLIAGLSPCVIWPPAARNWATLADKASETGRCASTIVE